MYGQDYSLKHVQESSKVSQGYASSECCKFVAGISIECQLYFWILKSYQHGTRTGGERDSRPKHIIGWTKNAAETFCMRLQKIKRPDASRHKKCLRPDTSFVQGLSGCTIHVLTSSCAFPVKLKSFTSFEGRHLHVKY